MAHLERNRVVRGQSVFAVCLLLIFTIGFLFHSIQHAYAQTADAAETVSISGTKFWVDQNGSLLPEDAHPDTAVLSLYADGVKVDEKSVSSADDWNWEFKDLPKFNENGEEISYVVREASLDDYTSDMKIALVNTYSPSKEITVKKVWNDSGNSNGTRPESVTVRLLADDVLLDSKILVLSDDNNWSGTFSGLPVMDAASEHTIEYKVEEEPVPNYTAMVKEDSEDEFTITNTYFERAPMFMLRRPALSRSEGSESPEENTESTEDQEIGNENITPQDTESGENGNSGTQENEENNNENTIPETPQNSEERENSGQDTNETPGRERETSPEESVRLTRIPESFQEVTVLPGTGLSGKPGLSAPAKISYEPLSLELAIPSLNISAGIVEVPFADGDFPVEGLGMDAGLLEGTALPGEGISILAAHNTLNSEEFGPFALISTLEKGERIFVRAEDGSMMIFEVYANEKIDAADIRGLFAEASAYEPSLTLLTCEDEMLEGGYASRRIVSARRVN